MGIVGKRNGCAECARKVRFAACNDNSGSTASASGGANVDRAAGRNGIDTPLLALTP